MCKAREWANRMSQLNCERARFTVIDAKTQRPVTLCEVTDEGFLMITAGPFEMSPGEAEELGSWLTAQFGGAAIEYAGMTLSESSVVLGGSRFAAKDPAARELADAAP
jgi:hypothetical protein